MALGAITNREKLIKPEPLGPYESVKEVKSEFGDATFRVVDCELRQDFKPYTKNFKDNPVVELLDNGKDFILDKPIDFYWWFYTPRSLDKSPSKLIPSTDRIHQNTELFEEIYVHTTIHPGFVTDFVSSPALLWSIVSPLGKAAKPSVLHDFFYRVPFSLSIPKGLKNNNRTKFTWTCTQKAADELFYESLKIRKVSKWKAFAMKKALDLYGHKTFNKYRKPA